MILEFGSSLQSHLLWVTLYLALVSRLYSDYFYIVLDPLQYFCFKRLVMRFENVVYQFFIDVDIAKFVQISIYLINQNYLKIFVNFYDTRKVDHFMKSRFSIPMFIGKSCTLKIV